MITTQQNKVLNDLITHYRSLSAKYNARRRDFLSEHDFGIACFLDYEGKERWDCSEKIADFIQENGGEVIYDALPSPGNYEPTPSVIEVLNEFERETVKVLTNLIAQEKVETSYLSFLNKLRYSAIKEEKEIAAISDYVKEASNSPYKMMVMDEWLIEKYGGCGGKD